jgi:hypothetical protein
MRGQEVCRAGVTLEGFTGPGKLPMLFDNKKGGVSQAGP